MNKKNYKYKKSEISKQGIIEAAIELVADNGFQGLSVRAITEIIGGTHSRVYYYFKDKEDLIANTLLYILKIFRTEVEKALIDESWSHEKIYKTFLRTMYNSFCQYPKHAQTYREFFFLSSHYVSKECYLRVVDDFIVPPKYSFDQIFNANKTVQILGYNNWKLIYRTIMDFALSNLENEEEVPEIVIETYINALWNAIKE